MLSPDDTIAAVATPLGEGGLGVIRVSGTNAIPVVQHIFKSAKRINLNEAATHTCHFGHIPGIDQVVITLFRAPHSYTGEDVIEISAHGNPFTLQKILTLCVAKGARLAGPGEFTQRAFIHGKMDLTQAEAVAELIGAKTDKTQTAAMAQLQGGLSQRVRHLRDQLLPLLAHIEVGLDHSDESHDFLSGEDLSKRCTMVQQGINALLYSAHVSKILREGLHIALIGRPNVGKSSLLNALLKEDRAIVTPTPGTTRDTLEETLNLHGIPVVLTDTAGLRQDSVDPIEQLGMERTHQSLKKADVVIGMFDGSEAFSAQDHYIAHEAMKKPHVWVINKSDLPQQFSIQQLQSFNGQAPLIELSTKTGEGLEQLIKTLLALSMGEKATMGEAQWLLNVRHQSALERASAALTRAQEAAQTDTYEECVALELQTALSSLGEIIGETTTEDLLGQIFSTFCIGK